MDDRKEKRTYGLKNVTIIDGKKSYHAVVTDISKQGLCIKTEHVFPTYKVIEVVIAVEDEPIKLTGSVRWVNENPHKPQPSLNEVGIALIKPPTEYLSYLDEISNGQA